MARSQETVAELLVSLGLDTGQFDKSLQEMCIRDSIRALWIK